MNNYLFLFTIGPVQSFIAQARKTKDLFAGSQILSDLIEEAINALIKMEPQSEIIFPGKGIPSKPNRFIAIIDNPEMIGKNLESIIRNSFREKVLKDIKDDFKNINDEKLNFHANSFLEIYWNAIPIENNSYNAHEYTRLEKELGEFKNARIFNQWEINSEKNRKCSICGERDNLVIKEKQLPNTISIKNDFRFEEGEGLCGICLYKRIYKVSSDSQSFDSTAEIATMDSIEYLLKNEKDIFLSYKNQIQSQFFDSQLLFEENLNRDYFKKQKKEPLIPNLNQLQKELKEINKKLEKAKLKFQKYYAIIVFDGDNMGKWLSGNNNLLKEDVPLKDFHKSLSECLGNFAKDCKDFLKNPNGRSVYAGGDDFLGFINLSYLIKSLNYFYESFDKLINLPLKSYLKENQKLSFSAGIAVAHYKTPLSEVINSARVMEKEAKSIDITKDAFAITILKHSGERQSCKLHWNDLKDSSNISKIEEIVQSLQTEKFSNTFMQNIVQEFKKLISKDKNESLNKIVTAEIDRLVERAYLLKEDKKENSEKLSKVVKDLYLYNDLNSKNPNNFFSVLGIADFLRKHKN
ncbi:MAG TPA: type III-B CRISPR-associated protein Cas10/Cmr2 [Leptospiraceae bacterium]|nr:type III-B CRISPR-associated protein Cas10/Cmr2 [Leptospiraceae bacterium]HMX34278.1 type III-B CRISPR-associated protein Cas10/Cmr2 [Leptospiraceae bacterium]HMY32693.1 type III-B CRISPR-associated protein Cas10/Cmr2 [Leptospiraceae bacterium]HMZ64883.1 type III-B CRISPR-associated protein Cas10/Cmr2 [Leptospiraceae bacterium]HNA05388.1 type III-B CRISPR-associated protein Cas10/Cmr2 [Leptospiraceae bacterium]